MQIRDERDHPSRLEWTQAEGYFAFISIKDNRSRQIYVHFIEAKEMPQKFAIIKNCIFSLEAFARNEFLIFPQVAQQEGTQFEWVLRFIWGKNK